MDRLIAQGCKTALLELMKEAFQQSAYGPTGGFVDFNQVSQIPPMQVPSLTTKPGSKASVIKRAFVSSPMAQLRSAQTAFDKPSMRTAGPSLSQQFKPKGFGTPAAGTLKPASGI